MCKESLFDSILFGINLYNVPICVLLFNINKYFMFKWKVDVEGISSEWFLLDLLAINSCLW